MGVGLLLGLTKGLGSVGVGLGLGLGFTKGFGFVGVGLLLGFGMDGPVLNGLTVPDLGF